ncbi:uncharacterized protein [Montipora capricornis]|uniref:uncharacterized protein isoform X4 n=1 Tax=Montipora capricornis TaxID=246305 RepID=UPI0035F17A96
MNKGPAARYLQNVELQQEVDKTARTVEKQERQIEALESQVGLINPSRSPKFKVNLKRHWKSAVIILLCLAVSVLATLISVSTVRLRHASSSEQSPQKSSLNLEMPLGQGQDSKSFFNFGVRLDSRLQECQEAHWKRSFPDIDYAFFGYDVLKGYPMASGHDPGFTHPIFLSKYSSGRQTSDCRYSVPEGLIVVPDVSCVTSFSSKVIRNKVEMSSSLAAAANVEGGGWGFKFSASASYKESVAQMSSGEFLYIVSQAQCRYYFSKLDVTDPPPFHPGFVRWANKLASSDASQDDLVQFIKYFGTHYVSEVAFGARFMKQHKVSQTKYKELREKAVSVEAQASYSGLFSVGGGFSLDSEQRSAASTFQKSVETSTVTVGAAPPSNGDAMTWASSVKENPVPTKYSLSPVYDLFTERYAQNLPGIDLNAMRERLINTSRNYCRILKEKGLIDSCDNSINLGTTLKGVDVTSFGYRYLTNMDEAGCRASCLLEDNCLAVQYSTDTRGCKLLDTKPRSVENKPTSKIVVFLPRLQRERDTLVFKNLKVKTDKQPRHSEIAGNITDCNASCSQDAFCAAFVFCYRDGGSWCETSMNCLLYSKQQVAAVEKDEEGYSWMYFVWKDYHLVTDNGRVQGNRRKRRVVPGERKDM